MHEIASRINFVLRRNVLASRDLCNFVGRSHNGILSAPPELPPAYGATRGDYRCRCGGRLGNIESAIRLTLHSNSVAIRTKATISIHVPRASTIGKNSSAAATAIRNSEAARRIRRHVRHQRAILVNLVESRRMGRSCGRAEHGLARIQRLGSHSMTVPADRSAMMTLPSNVARSTLFPPRNPTTRLWGKNGECRRGWRGRMQTTRWARLQILSIGCRPGHFRLATPRGCSF